MDQQSAPTREREPALRKSPSPPRVTFDEKKIEEQKAEAQKLKEARQKAAAQGGASQKVQQDLPEKEDNEKAKKKEAWRPWWQHKKAGKGKGKKRNKGSFSDPEWKEKSNHSTARVVEMKK